MATSKHLFLPADKKVIRRPGSRKNISGFRTYTHEHRTTMNYGKNYDYLSSKHPPHSEYIQWAAAEKRNLSRQGRQ